jgi:hypothetical protein
MRFGSSVSEQLGEQMRVKTEGLRQQGRSLAPHQIRTCARCGRTTTFMLEDAAGGWYSCTECGRYA